MKTNVEGFAKIETFAELAKTLRPKGDMTVTFIMGVSGSGKSRLIDRLSGVGQFSGVSLIDADWYGKKIQYLDNNKTVVKWYVNYLILEADLRNRGQEAVVARTSSNVQNVITHFYGHGWNVRIVNLMSDPTLIRIASARKILDTIERGEVSPWLEGILTVISFSDLGIYEYQMKYINEVAKTVDLKKIEGYTLTTKFENSTLDSRGWHENSSSFTKRLARELIVFKENRFHTLLKKMSFTNDGIVVIDTAILRTLHDWAKDPKSDPEREQLWERTREELLTSITGV